MFFGGLLPTAVREFGGGRQGTSLHWTLQGQVTPPFTAADGTLPWPCCSGIASNPSLVQARYCMHAAVHVSHALRFVSDTATGLAPMPRKPNVDHRHATNVASMIELPGVGGKGGPAGRP